MAAKICPLCGEMALQTMHGEFRFEPPPNIPGGTLVIPNVTWRPCTARGEDIIPHELEGNRSRTRAAFGAAPARGSPG